MAEWDRELVVDPEAVRQAAGAPRTWRLLGAGWDSDAWLADESVVWRVPRRQVAIASLRREAALMPLLAPCLPSPTPVPVLVEVEGLPPLARHTLVAGREMAKKHEYASGLGASLGRFLRTLHDPERVKQVGALLPSDPISRGDPAIRVPSTHRRLDQIADLVDVRSLRPIVDAAAGVEFTMDVVCHGDLHLRHVLLNGAGELSGVIDWGDSCVGMVAMDLAIVTALSAEEQESFFEAYGAVDYAAWRHARMLGVLLGVLLGAALLSC